MERDREKAAWDAQQGSAAQRMGKVQRHVLGEVPEVGELYWLWGYEKVRRAPIDARSGVASEPRITY